MLWALGGGWVALIVIIWGVWWLVSQGHQMGWGCPIGVIWDVVIDAPLASHGLWGDLVWGEGHHLRVGVKDVGDPLAWGKWGGGHFVGAGDDAYQHQLVRGQGVRGVPQGHSRVRGC